MCHPGECEAFHPNGTITDSWLFRMVDFTAPFVFRDNWEEGNQILNPLRATPIGYYPNVWEVQKDMAIMKHDSHIRLWMLVIDIVVDKNRVDIHYWLQENDSNVRTPELMRLGWWPPFLRYSIKLVADRGVEPRILGLWDQDGLCIRSTHPRYLLLKFGSSDRVRTDDIPLVRRMLYQLSYGTNGIYTGRENSRQEL